MIANFKIVGGWIRNLLFGWICIVVTPVEARDSFTIFKTLGSPVEGLSGVSTNGDIASVVGDDNAIYSLVYLTGNGVDSTNDQGIVRVAPGGPVEQMIANYANSGLVG